MVYAKNYKTVSTFVKVVQKNCGLFLWTYYISL